MNDEHCEIGSIPLPNSTWLVGAVSVFQSGYGEVHPYLAIVLCIAGTLMNIITVIVLTRPQLISPVNVLLCAVALCDIVVMTSYFVFVVHFLLSAANRCEPDDYSYGWASFTIFHAHASVIFHATSIWITVSLAQIRVLTIRRATSGPTKGITERGMVFVSLLTCLIMTAVNLPNFMTFEIVEVPAMAFLTCLTPIKDEIFDTGASIVNATMSAILDDAPLLEEVGTADVALAEEVVLDNEDNFLNDSTPAVFTVRAHEKDCFKLKMAFWSNGMIFKVVPCFLLTVSIIALLKVISDVSHRRKSLAQVMKKKVPKDRTTPMLVAVLSIFLLAELPQGVMLVMTGVFSSKTFHQKIYLPLGDFMDLLSLLNSAVNFLIYCVMSRKFRSVFFKLFFRCCTDKFEDSDGGNPYIEKTDYSRRPSSALTYTTNNTKTEQLSHHLSTASTMNASAVDNYPARPRSYNNNLLSVDDAASRRSSASDHYHSRRLPSNASFFEPEKDSIILMAKSHGQKRISFNISVDPPSKVSDKFPAKCAIVKSPRVSTLAKLRKQLPPLRRLGHFFWNNEAMMLIDSTSSPQRRYNNLQAETNFVAMSF